MDTTPAKKVTIQDCPVDLDKADPGNLLLGELAKLAALGGGFLTAGPNAWITSISKLLQGALSGRFFQELSRETRQYVDTGKIRPDFVESSKGHATVKEMFEYLDNDKPDDVTFNFLKRLFLSLASDESAEAVLSAQYLKVARKLTAGEIQLLMACYERAKNEPPGHWTRQVDSHAWSKDMAEASGLQHQALVTYLADSLTEKGLFAPKDSNHDRNVYVGKGCRVSDFGFALCEFVSRYEGEDKG